MFAAGAEPHPPLFGFPVAAPTRVKVLWHFSCSPLGFCLVYGERVGWGREGGRVRRFPAKTDSCCRPGPVVGLPWSWRSVKEEDGVGASSLGRADKMSVFSLCRARDGSWRAGGSWEVLFVGD